MGTLHHSSLLKRGDLKVTGKVTTFSCIINEHFDYNPNNILINVILHYYIELKELEWLCYMQTTIMMLQTENKEQLQTTTLPEEKKAEGGSSCTYEALKLAALEAGLD